MKFCEGPSDRPPQGSLEAFQQLSVAQTEQQGWMGGLLPLPFIYEPSLETSHLLWLLFDRKHLKPLFVLEVPVMRDDRIPFLF